MDSTEGEVEFKKFVIEFTWNLSPKKWEKEYLLNTIRDRQGKLIVIVMDYWIVAAAAIVGTTVKKTQFLLEISGIPNTMIFRKNIGPVSDYLTFFCFMEEEVEEDTY